MDQTIPSPTTTATTATNMPNNDNSNNTNMPIDDIDPYSYQDPLPPTLRENDHFLLHFADNRQLFAQALPKWKCSKGFVPCKINKRTYWTHDLIGLPYGTVLEVGNDRGLIPLGDGEDLLPNSDDVMMDVMKNEEEGEDTDNNYNDIVTDSTTTTNGNVISKNDNRNLIDDNKSQKLTPAHVENIVSTGGSGSDIVAALISNSSTFHTKTSFSQAKYVKKKQLKYQQRCRIVRITPSTLCSALHLKDSRKISNLRDDTLGQIVSNANITAGSRVLIFDNAVQGLITSSCTRRMGGYGSIFSLYVGHQPGYLDGVVNKMNFTVGEKQSLKWISVGEIFGDYNDKIQQTQSMTCDEETGKVVDVEQRDRDEIQWPLPLMAHTRNYVENELKDDRKVAEFLDRRSARFARKLTRNSMLELRELIDECRDTEENLDGGLWRDSSSSLKNGNNLSSNGVKTKEKGDSTIMDTTTTTTTTTNNIPRQCDSLIIATKYDPTATLLRLLPYLAPSCPFVIYHEFLEPLLDTFHTLQNYYVSDNDDNADDDTNGMNDVEEGKKKTKKAKQPMMQQRNIAINLRLTDTWFREYQVLEGRTHPNMNMSQNGGYILMGTKLCSRTGTNELGEDAMKEIRARVGGRRKQNKVSKRKQFEDNVDAAAEAGIGKRNKVEGGIK